MAGIKKTIIISYFSLIALTIIAPALFIPQFLFGESASSIAIIGGSEESTSILFTGRPTKWGNILFPAIILLSVFNIIYLISYIIGGIRQIKR
jgi:hypothetical protein